MNIDPIIISCASALCAVIVLLWRKDLQNQRELKRELLAEIGKRDNIIEDMVKRIRKLEDERLSQSKEHADEIKKLTMQVAHVLGENRVALIQVAKALQGIGHVLPPLSIAVDKNNEDEIDVLVSKMTHYNHA